MQNQNNVREIVLDTETTGLDPKNGDRIVEIGCVELINSVVTGQNFHVYIDPERHMPPEAFRIHGLSTAFLTGKPKFANIAGKFSDFIRTSNLVIHNAEFDIKFLNSELARCGQEPLMMDRVVDTLALARRKHPGTSNSLDALCSRYKVDNSKRTKHGALLDAEILADLYVKLTGGRQTVFVLTEMTRQARAKVQTVYTGSRFHTIDLAIQIPDLVAHTELIREMGDRAFWHIFQLDIQERSDDST